MSSITSTNSNALRITGMATGLDTDTLIKQMIAAENAKLDKLKQNRQYNEWKQEAFRDIIKDFRGLRDDYLLASSPSSTNMIKSANYSAATITSSNSNAVTATALPGAATGASSVEVIKIAKSAKLEGTSLGANVTTSKTLGELGIGATSFTITVGANTSTQIDLEADDTLSEVISKIYDAKDTDVSTSTLYDDIKVSFSELTGGLTIQTRDTGSSQSIKISANVLGFTSQDPTVENGGQGQNAEVKITPVGSSTEITVTDKTTNSFTIDNVNYNLIKDPNGTPYTVDLTTAASGQASVDKIKTFIEKYNALVEKINTKLTEKKNYDYAPLTDAQKEEMETEDITTWETKAKKGILRNDSELQNVLYNMRAAFTSEVTAAGLTLKEIGIDTYSGSDAVTKPGQLRIVDENKLKTALEERGDQVMKLFTAAEPTTVPAGTIDEEKYKYDNTGILQRIDDIIYDVAGKSDATLLKRAGYENTASEYSNTLTKQLLAQDKSIDEMMDRIYEKQERYYQMFAKLESAMNSMNAQQSWLTQSLSS